MDQIHVGKHLNGKTVFHSENNGEIFWSGWQCHETTPEELYFICRTTIAGLQKLFPNLEKKVLEKLID